MQNFPTPTVREDAQGSVLILLSFNIFRAKQVNVQREVYGYSLEEQQIEQRASLEDQRGEHEAGQLGSSPKESVSSSERKTLPEAELQMPCSSTLNEAVDQIGKSQNQGLTYQQQTENSPPDSINPNRAPVDFCSHEISAGTRKSKRCLLNDAREDPHPQRAKKMCLGRPPTTMQTHSTECFTQTSKCDPLPLTPLTPDETKAESKAFPVSECKKTTLEVELLTPGKQAQRLPLTSNNTAQTNQNRLAASLRGLSVKLASSGSSISSRSTFGKEGSENVPRTSRLRRLKRS